MNREQFGNEKVVLAFHGYGRGAPSEEVREGDSKVAEAQKCKDCGAPCRYVPYSDPRRHLYIAFAECIDCGSAREF